MNEIADPRAMIGGNNPPETLADMLADKYRPLFDRMTELVDAAKQAPETIADDITHAKVVELAKAMRKTEQEADKRREDEREPFKAKVEEINGLFKSRIDPVEKLRKVLMERHTAYSQKKAAEEQRRLAEEAEKRRQAEAEALAAAQEAQRTKLNAEAQQREAERLAEFARDSRNAAASDVQIAAADVAEIKAEIGHIHARLLAVDAEFARKRQAGEPVTAEARALAKAADQGNAAEAAGRLQAAEQRLQKARSDEADARRKQQAAEAEAAAQRRAAAAAERDERDAMNTAMREDRRATRFEEKAAGPEADLARTRSEHGAVGTLTRRWQCRVIDRDALDRDALWPFINGEAIEAALWKWMMAQTPDKRVMSGASMSEETEGAVR